MGFDDGRVIACVRETMLQVINSSAEPWSWFIYLEMAQYDRVW